VGGSGKSGWVDGANLEFSLANEAPERASELALQSNFSFSFRNLLAAAPLKPRGAKCTQRARENRVGSERGRRGDTLCATTARKAALFSLWSAVGS
jgi:hypothetical protein